MMTREEFDPQIGRLIILRGWPDHADEHYRALSDIPLETFEKAVDHALKTRTWFPTPSELRLDADAVEAKRHPKPAVQQWERPAHAEARTIANPFGGKPITIYVDREWRFDCDRCHDLGTRSWQCGEPSKQSPETPVQHCGRRGDHGSHEWVDRCDCYDFNPTIRRRLEAQRKHYTEAQAGGKR